MTQFRSECGKSTSQTEQWPVKALTCSILIPAEHIKVHLLHRAAAKLPNYPIFIPFTSDNFLFESRFPKSPVWRAAVTLRDSTHTPHAAVTLPNTRQDKSHRVSEIPGGSSSNLPPILPLCYRKNSRGPDWTWGEDAGIQWFGCRIFFFFTLHVVLINLLIILILHSGFRLRGKSKITRSHLEETSFPLPVAHIFGLPETSQTRDYKI